MGNKFTVEETEKKKVNSSLCQVDSFTNDAGRKEGSNIIKIFLKKIQKTLKPIRTIKSYLETLRNFKNQGDVKKSKEVNTKYCFRRNIEDYIADKGKKSGADYLAHF